jgi:integrase/recombinase XerD
VLYKLFVEEEFMTALEKVSKTDPQKLLENVPEHYKYAVRKLVNFLDDNGYNIGDPQVWDAWIREIRGLQTSGKMKNKKYSASTINHYIDALVDRLRYALKNSDLTMEEKVRVNEAIDGLSKKRPKRADHRVQEEEVLTYSEIREMIAELRNKRDKLHIAMFIEFIAYTGVRVSEMLNILISDIKPINSHYKVHIRGKGDRERDVHLPKELLDSIKEYLGGDTYLFTGYKNKPYTREYVSMNIKREGERILRRDISAHTLRHSYATHILKKHGTQRVEALRKLLGHSDISTTLNLYCHDTFTWEEQLDLFK